MKTSSAAFDAALKAYLEKKLMRDPIKDIYPHVTAQEAPDEKYEIILNRLPMPRDKHPWHLYPDRGRAGFSLKTYNTPIKDISVIYSDAEKEFGGGRYIGRIIDSHGNYLKCFHFVVSGFPTKEICDCPPAHLLAAGCKSIYHK